MQVGMGDLLEECLCGRIDMSGLFRYDVHFARFHGCLHKWRVEFKPKMIEYCYFK